MGVGQIVDQNSDKKGWVYGINDVEQQIRNVRLMIRKRWEQDKQQIKILGVWYYVEKKMGSNEQDFEKKDGSWANSKIEFG